MVRKFKNKLNYKSKKFSNISKLLGTQGGSHGRLSLPIVSGGYRKSKRMVRSNTRIRTGITSNKNMVRSGTRIRQGISMSGGYRNRRNSIKKKQRQFL